MHEDICQVLTHTDIEAVREPFELKQLRLWRPECSMKLKVRLYKHQCSTPQCLVSSKKYIPFQVVQGVTMDASKCVSSKVISVVAVCADAVQL